MRRRRSAAASGDDLLGCSASGAFALFPGSDAAGGCARPIICGDGVPMASMSCSSEEVGNVPSATATLAA